MHSFKASKLLLISAPSILQQFLKKEKNKQTNKDYMSRYLTATQALLTVAVTDSQTKYNENKCQ